MFDGGLSMSFSFFGYNNMLLSGATNIDNGLRVEDTAERITKALCSVLFHPTNLPVSLHWVGFKKMPSILQTRFHMHSLSNGRREPRARL